MRKEDTFFRDNSWSLFQRTLGQRLYNSDMDSLNYTYENNKVKFVFVVDYKCILDDSKELYPIDLKRSSIQAQLELANQLRLPFFVVVTYLTDNYDIPMYYVYPGNFFAHRSLLNIKEKNKKHFQDGGCWMSVKMFSAFQHHLRGLKVDKEEVKDLSNKFSTYNLPEIG